MRRTAVLLLLAGVGAASAQGVPTRFAPAGDPHEQAAIRVLAPHFGDVLFEHYQQRWFPAITSLMVSQQFDRLDPHGDDGELLRGGLLLAYGQHDEAAAIFERLVDARPALRDRAWYFLARARYERGRFVDAEAALARIERPLPGDLQADRVLLQGQLLLARDTEPAAAEAAALLQALAAEAGRSMGATGPGAPRVSPAVAMLARFNAAAAWARAGRPQEARAQLDALGRERATDEEQRSLRDRANLALGVELLRAEQAGAARGALQRVRLHGAESAAALLAHGWAAHESKQLREALVAWLELSTRPSLQAAALESRLAVPQAYAELGARAQAIAGYEAAVARFDDDRRRLDETIGALREGRALAPLLEARDHELGGAAVRSAPASPAGASAPSASPSQDEAPSLRDVPYADTLAPLFAEHAFQVALTRYRDLRWLQANLQRWQQSLAAFDDMLATRRAAFAGKLPAALQAADDGARGLVALQQRRDALAGEVDAAEAAADGVALADAADFARLQRVAALRDTVAAMPAGAERELAAERLRRVAGALTWQLAAAHADRLWSARKTLVQIDRQIGEATAHQAALRRAQAAEPQRFEQLGARLSVLSQRVATLQPRVLALADEQRAALQDIAVGVLQRLQQRMEALTAQARFALAQLQDGATVAAGEGHAAR